MAVNVTATVAKWAVKCCTRSLVSRKVFHLRLHCVMVMLVCKRVGRALGWLAGASAFLFVGGWLASD